jgi:hypothetical protein
MKILIRNSGKPLKAIIGNQKHQFKDGPNDLPDEVAVHLLKFYSKNVVLPDGSAPMPKVVDVPAMPAVNISAPESPAEVIEKPKAKTKKPKK